MALGQNVSASPGQPIFHAPLTKRALAALPDGVFLMSGVTDNLGSPIHAGAVPSGEGREAFWRHLKEIGVAGRNCWVFASAEDYGYFLRSMNVGNAPPGSPFSGEGNQVH